VVPGVLGYLPLYPNDTRVRWKWSPWLRLGARSYCHFNMYLVIHSAPPLRRAACALYVAMAAAPANAGAGIAEADDEDLALNADLDDRGSSEEDDIGAPHLAAAVVGGKRKTTWALWS